MPEAIHQVIVDQAGRLQMRVDDRAADEAEAAALEILGHCDRLRCLGIDDSIKRIWLERPEERSERPSLTGQFDGPRQEFQPFFVAVKSRPPAAFVGPCDGLASLVDQPLSSQVRFLFQ